MVSNGRPMSEPPDMAAVIQEGLEQVTDQGPGWWVTLKTPEERTVEVMFNGNRSWSVNFTGGVENVEDAREWLQRRGVPLDYDNEAAVTIELSDQSRQAVSELVVAYLQSIDADSVSIDYIENMGVPSSDDGGTGSTGERAGLESLTGIERVSVAGDMVDEGRNLDCAVSALGEAFRNGNAEVSHLAGDYLVKAGEVAASELEETLQNADDEFLLRAATERLEEMGEAARSAVPTLIGLLDDSRQSVRYVASKALIDITEDEHADLVVPPLTEAIREPPDEVGEKPWLVRLSAVLKLPRLGEKAAPATDALIWILENENATEWGRVVNGPAAMALGRIGVHALPDLTEAYESDAEETRVSVIQALGGLGEEGIPLLRRAFSDQSPKVRRMAAISAIQLRWKAMSLLPAMLSGLGDSAIRDGVATGFKVYVFEWTD